MQLFKVEGTDMAPNLLLMCKIFVLLLYAHSFYFYLSDPFLPIISLLDGFNAYPNVFEYISKALFLIFSVSLCFNIKVRMMSALLGVLIILNLLASKPLFRNHLFIVGCMLLLSGLSDKNKSPWLIYMQLGVVYVGALINKVFQVDWWLGQFMHNWLGTALENSLYLSFAKELPDLLLAKLLSYMAMLSEFFIAICLFIPRLRRVAISIILVFHTLLFTFTGETFGIFMEDILIVLIAFLVWPKRQSVLQIKSIQHFKWLKLLSFLDWDNRVLLKQNSKIDANLYINMEDKKFSNWAAFTGVLLQYNGFFVLILVFEMAIRYLFNGFSKYIGLLFLFWLFLMLLLPYFWQNRKLKRV
ncbi:hypothetical protein [Winogradskyella sp. R77965]|uniref:hypothetical protein n=1 Tax=Winogradskyella sp. R77965 TaxID=3093872 RepID=UPI0037DCFB8D